MHKRIIRNYSTTSSGSTYEPAGGWDYIDTDWTAIKFPFPSIRPTERLSRAQLRRLIGELPKAKVGEMIWI